MSSIIFIPAGGTGGGGGERGPEGPAGPKGEFNFRGAWSGATEYAKGDAVEEGGSTYASLKAGNLNHKPSELGEWWSVVAAKGATGGAGANGTNGEGLWRGVWSGVTEYTKGDIVEEGGSSYIAIKSANTNHKPSELGVWWNLVAAKGAEGGAAAANWVNMEAYNAGLTQTSPIQFAVLSGLVYLRGLGKTSAEIAAKGTLFTLPVAARPANVRNLVYNIATGTATSNLTVKLNGECETATLLAINKIPSFDGLVFSL